MNKNSQKAPKESYQNFYGRDFFVTKDVLTPRPETEQIIDAVLYLAGKPYLPGVKPSKNVLPKSPRIIDVGTGSGCIAITLNLELKNIKILATDISKPALKIAQKNAQRFGVDPNLFIISDLLENVKFTPDVIVANLPYVDENWEWLDKKSLEDDPSLALYAKDSGTKLIKKLINEANERKVKYLILEADPSQHQVLINYAKNNQYKLMKKMGFILLFVTL